MNHDITEYMTQLQELTTRNLEILKALNESFYTKKNHLVATIDNVNYVIPSFLSLENKIDTLQQNLENICDAPKTGEAVTYFDGTTQKVQLLGYSTAPTRLTLNPVTKFSTKSNDVFKDFMTPVPYLKLDITSISNSTKNIVIKKVCLKNVTLQQQVAEASANNAIRYSDLAKILYLYDEDVDYTEYDTTQRLPYRRGGTEGSYTIETIVDNWTDSDFNEFYTLVINEDLVYYGEEETIQYDLIAGDKLVTRNGKVQLEITEVHPLSKTMTVKVLYGGYVNLATTSSLNADLYTLDFYSSINYNDIKYAEVPLEEDRFVCIFVAAINDTLNVQGAWGSGLFMDVDTLTMADGTNFRTYYDENVNNIGDTLFDITQMLNSSLTNLTESQWDSVKDSKPSILSSNLTVTQINKHLNDSETIKQIRSLYDQKNKYKSDLDTTQRSIEEVNSILSSLSFDDTTNSRSLYTAKLSELNSQKINLTDSIYAVSNEIAAAANSADVPIENAKYHIRGFIDTPSITIGSITSHVIKLDVEYRYKNVNKFTGNAETIGEGDNVYSDWNKMTSSFYKYKHPSIGTNGSFEFHYDEDNSSYNEPSFNQIDIPISQGESVDVRVRFIYDLGFPFVETLSDWSDVFNVVFPEEYVEKVDIVQIIEDNNQDIKNNYFSATLNKIGVTEHCSDKIEDQNITYFHSPEHISSGFYTPERRIVPLFDKLNEMINDISDLKSEVLGQQSDNLQVYISDDQNSMLLQPYTLNTFYTGDYTNNENKITANTSDPNIADILGMDVAYTQLNLNIYNAGSYNMKLYSMFPGSPSSPLTSNATSKFKATDYVTSVADYGVWMQLDDTTDTATMQRFNQILYFRVNDPFTNTKYYTTSVGSILNTTLPGSRGIIASDLDTTNYTAYFNEFIPSSQSIQKYGVVYPYVGQIANICLETGSQFLTIKAGESISIPLSFYYAFNVPSAMRVSKITSIDRTIAFDIRTSLYKDPIPYRITISANYADAKPLILKKADNTLRIGNKSIGVPYSPVINKVAKVNQIINNA